MFSKNIHGNTKILRHTIAIHSFISIQP